MIDHKPVHWIVGVDVDGTIFDSHKENFDPIVHRYSPVNFKGEKLMADVREALGILKDGGFEIVLYTARTNPTEPCNKPYSSAQVIQALHETMQDNEIPYDRITEHKPVADMYIDDKGWHFTNWKQMVDDLYTLGWVFERIKGEK